MHKVGLLVQYVATIARYATVEPFRDRYATKRLMSDVLEFDFRRGVGRALPTVSIYDLFPEVVDLRWNVVGTPTNDEALQICGAMRALNARRVVEIGTYIGATTIQLAANLPDDDGCVFTVDIDPADLAGLDDHISSFDRKLVQKQRVELGSTFRGTEYEGRIRQILGDSAAIDYGSIVGEIDLAFIDGGHSYEQVRADTEAILPHMRPGGAIFWHDYQPVCPGVVRYLHELQASRPVKHLRETQLAALRLPA